jgi:hypothetical protein
MNALTSWCTNSPRQYSEHCAGVMASRSSIRVGPVASPVAGSVSDQAAASNGTRRRRRVDAMSNTSAGFLAFPARRTSSSRRRLTSVVTSAVILTSLGTFAATDNPPDGGSVGLDTTRRRPSTARAPLTDYARSGGTGTVTGSREWAP